MSGWNEDNFLESLLAAPRPQSGAGGKTCPDAETLYVVRDGGGSAALRVAVAAHLGRCEACAEIQDRLLHFEQGISTEQDAEWKETGKRLDRWMDDFLNQNAAGRTGAERPQPASATGRWYEIWKPSPWWKVQWALGMALVVLLAAGVYVVKRWGNAAPAAQIASRAIIPQADRPVAVEKPVQSNDSGKNPVRPTPAKKRNSAPRRPASETPRADVAVGTATAVDSPQPLTVPAPVVKAAPSEPTLQASAGQAAAPQTPTAPRTPTAAVSKAASVRASSPPARRAHADAPSSLRFDAGTRLWIRMKSIDRRSNGSFAFRGTLFQRTALAGGVALEPGAEIAGSGTVSRGKTSLLVTELVHQKARYTLKSQTGGAIVRSPGSGGAVSFNAGRVLEMWLASDSTYENAASAIGGAEP